MSHPHYKVWTDSISHSSLLDILAGRKAKKGLNGIVLINGQEQPRNFKCISGYVVQVRQCLLLYSTNIIHAFMCLFNHNWQGHTTYVYYLKQRVTYKHQNY